MPEIIKTVLSQPCYCCNNSINGTNNNKKECPACNNTGIYSENFYTFIVKDKTVPKNVYLSKIPFRACKEQIKQLYNL